jgi:hypothetical protein
MIGQLIERNTIEDKTTKDKKAVVLENHAQATTDTDTLNEGRLARS